MHDNVPVLSTVTPGRERYCPLLAGQLDRMWPGHGPQFFALPAGQSAPYDRVIQSEAATWTGTLLSGLRFLRAQSAASYVFVLLEDHVPLWSVDAKLLASVSDIARRESLPVVFFPKYRWRRFEVVIGGQRMARMPAGFHHYYQCQPALWNLDYYLDVVAESVRRGVTDPWTFEQQSLPNPREHFVSDYRWPSRRCGYLKRGRVDWRAIGAISLPDGRPLRDELLREYLQRPLPTGIIQAVGSCLRAAVQIDDASRRFGGWLKHDR